MMVCRYSETDGGRPEWNGVDVAHLDDSDSYRCARCPALITVYELCDDCAKDNEPFSEPEGYDSSLITERMPLS